MRTIWKGHLTFGLISVPVGLYTALESSEKVSFRMLHRKDLAPIQYKKFCSKEDVEVENDEIVKGYEVEKNKFAIVEDEELEKMQEETAGEEDHTVEVLEFVDLFSISPLSFEKPYYLAPEKGGDKAYAVLRDALIEEKKVGIAKITIRNRPQLGALVPSEHALALEILRPFEEIRSTSGLRLPESAKKSAEIKMAKMLIDQMTTEWDPAEHPNEYRQALTKLLAAKKKFVVRKPRAGEENVVDLMAALKKSVGKTKTRPAARKKVGVA
jgi:DNA end-binding protein Ku